MKKLIAAMSVLTLLCGFLLSCSNGSTDKDKNPPTPGGLGNVTNVTINRASQTAGNFVFSTNAVTGAEVYQAYKGAAKVAEKTSNTGISIPSSSLDATAVTPLKARAAKADNSQASDTDFNFPGIKTYQAGNAGKVELYTDWFNFLDKAFDRMKVQDYVNYSINYEDLHNNINYNNLLNTTEAMIPSIESSFLSDMQTATTRVLGTDWSRLDTATQNSMLPYATRLWFNQKTNEQANLNTKFSLKATLEAAYPGTTII